MIKKTQIDSTLDQSQFDNTQTHMNQIQLDEKIEGDYKSLNLKREQSIDYEHETILQKIPSGEQQAIQNIDFFSTCLNVNTPSQIGDGPPIELNNIESSDRNDSINTDKVQLNNISHQKRISQLNLFQNRLMPQRNTPNLEQFISTINIDQLSSVQKKASIAYQIEEGQESMMEVKSMMPEEKVPVRLMKAINLLVNVKHFYRQLTKNSRIFEKITQKQHQLIGDITARYKKNTAQQNGKKNTCEKLIQIMGVQCLYWIKWVLRNIKLFQPNHIFKRLWDTFNAIAIIYFLYIISLVIFFSMNTSSYKSIFTLGFIFFIIDMIFTFNTAIIEKGNVNTKRQTVALQYLKGNFLWDFLGLFPFIVIYFEISLLDSISSKLAYGFIVFKLFLLFDILDSISFYFSFQRNKKNLVDLFKVIFLIISVCHLFSILWHGLALYEMTILERDDTWINNQNLVEADIYIRYIYSFYFLAVTMQTVGYGDITPKNPIEILFTVITMFCTGMIWAFSLNSIGNIISNINKTNQEYKNDMELIHSFMRDEQVDSKLKVKVSNYLEYLHKVTYFKFLQNLTNQFFSFQIRQLICHLIFY